MLRAGLRSTTVVSVTWRERGGQLSMDLQSLVAMRCREGVFTGHLVPVAEPR